MTNAHIWGPSGAAWRSRWYPRLSLDMQPALCADWRCRACATVFPYKDEERRALACEGFWRVRPVNDNSP
jgi:hypothetical protein